MAIDVNLEPKTQRSVGRHYVYVKSKWKHQWTYIPWLFADEVAWRLAPGISTASLSWRYGVGMRQGETKVDYVNRLAPQRRLYFKIEFQGEVVPGVSDQNFGFLSWYGTCELDSRQLEGVVRLADGSTDLPSGLQSLECVDLAHSLYRKPIRSHRWLDSAGKEHIAGRPAIFNRPNHSGSPTGNRSTNKGIYAFLFSSQVGGEDKLWTTRTIVDYLTNYEQPKGAGGLDEFTLLMDRTAELLLPDFDEPVLDPEDQTTGSLMDVLMPRSRMLSWYLRVEPLDVEGDTHEVVRLTPVSLLDEDVPLDNGHYFKKNNRQLRLQTTRTADASPEIRYNLRESDMARIDQVRVRGALRTSTCTLAHPDGTLDKGWSQELEDEYNGGASERDGYGDLTTAQKQVWNNDVRSSDRLLAVYCRFAIPNDWDGVVLDGLGGENANPVFLEKENDLSTKHAVNPRELWIAPTLPLLDGYDYRDLGSPSEPKPPVRVSTGPHERLTALVLFKDPTTAGFFFDSPRYVQVEKIGLAANTEEEDADANFKWSGRVEIPDEDRAVLVHVNGQPQHTIATDEFERLDGADEFVGKWDWKDALFTVALFDDRYAEGVWPPDNQVDQGLTNLKRELVLRAGDAYRQDWLVPNTVVGINEENGQLLRCASGGWIQDDTRQLQNRAKQVHAYFRRTRRALSLETPHISAAIRIGDFIVSFGDVNNPRLVGSIVSEVVLMIPESSQPEAAKIKYVTEFAELDATELLNRR